MNPTTQAIIANLRRLRPGASLVTPVDIANAYEMESPNAVIRDIDEGRLHVNRLHKRTFIAMAEAERYIRENEPGQSKGTLP